MLSANTTTTLPHAIFLMGPTAGGKTDLAVALTQQLPCDIISVDSALIYKGMNIGTAKPDAATLACAPHRLISFLDPAEPYSAAQFRSDALHEMTEISSRGRIPLLVGGTMLYFKVLLEGLAELPPSEPAVRASLTEEAVRYGWPAMHARLAAIDPETATKLHPNHSQRILRALEVHQLSGIALSTLQRQQQSAVLPWQICQLALAPADRTMLHQRAERRFDEMLANGFLAEVRCLHARQDLHPDLPAIRSVGYRQAWQYLNGEITADQWRETSIAATRQLAKRQLTWLRSWPDLHWILTEEPFDQEKVTQTALNILKSIDI